MIVRAWQRFGLQGATHGRLLLLAVLLLLPAWAGAVDADNVRFQRLDPQRGLSQSTVTALAQDTDGLMWIGTQSGLNRFDGYAVTVFLPTTGSDDSLADNFITALEADPESGVWVATLNGVNHFDARRGRFRTFRHQPGRAVGLPAAGALSLHRDGRGVLWVGTELGLAFWDEALADFRPLAAEIAAGLPDPRINDIASDARGRLWLATARGLALFDTESRTLQRPEAFPFPDAPVTRVCIDDNDRIFAGLDIRGVVLGSVHGTHWQVLPVGEGPGRLGSAQVRRLLVDREGTLWVGSEAGLDRVVLDGERIVEVTTFRHHRNDAGSLGGGGVASLLQDREGTLWAGTWNSGLSWFNRDNSRFASYTLDTPATAGFRNPASIGLAASPGRLWVGSGSGLYGFDFAANRLWPVSEGDDAHIYYSGRLIDGQIWFGNARGLRRLDPDSGAFRDQTLPETLQEGRLRRFWVDPERLWLAADPLGVAQLDRNFDTVLRITPIPRAITFIEPLGDRWRLVGAYSGLYWFDAATGEWVFTHELGNSPDVAPASLPSAPMDLAVGIDRRVWLASNGGGLLEMVGDGVPEHPSVVRFRAFGQREGLRDPALKAMEVDDQGRLWISTSSGISLFDPVEGRFQNFSRGHGTLGRDYINGSAAKLADGRIAFGGMEGFTVFDPRRAGEPISRTPAPPQIVGIEVDGAPLTVDGNREAALALAVRGGQGLQLPAGGLRSLSLRFASTEYLDPGMVRYQYRLDPLDPDWVSTGADSRVATYTGLAPDRYRFQLRAAHADSAWSAVSDYVVDVPYLWWQTIWARLALAIAIAMLLWMLHQMRLRGIARQSHRLAQLVEERTHELQQRTLALEESKTRAENAVARLESTQVELVRSEKMAALGQLVAGVAHEVNTPLGVAVTASSLLRESGRRFEGQIASGQVKRSDFNRFLETVEETTAMIERNLDRAAQLIANFKQVSVDRTSDGRRRFELSEYLGEVLESLRLMWKRRSIQIEVDNEPGLLMDSFPGAIGQIVTNLTQNAVLHAFGEGAGGTLRIACRRLSTEWIEMTVSDDGCGIPSENLQRIFDPFFTTRRNEGGTGLGLHIVFNLVTQKLGGTIRVTSEPGKGTQFTLSLPQQAPA